MDEQPHVRSRAAVLDPVCGMQVDPEYSHIRAQHAGKTYHFCSNHCHKRFLATPEKYLQASTPGEAACCGSYDTQPVPVRDKRGNTASYTCPMTVSMVSLRPISLSIAMTEAVTPYP